MFSVICWSAPPLLESQLAGISISHAYCNPLERHTFVCHTVKDVDVITANRCPVREILKANNGSLSADLKDELP